MRDRHTANGASTFHIAINSRKTQRDNDKDGFGL